jgi:hypothetical protein
MAQEVLPPKYPKKKEDNPKYLQTINEIIG